jgi:hypothetical protein
VGKERDERIVVIESPHNCQVGVDNWGIAGEGEDSVRWTERRRRKLVGFDSLMEHLVVH